MRVVEDDRMKGVYWVERGEGRRSLATRNLAPGIRVYGEELIKVGDEEYRVWDPYRSKLAGAILKGIDASAIRPRIRVLYLGASTGTTVSHVSDIVGEKGIVFSVEVASRVMREFVDRVANHRANVVPLLFDARHPEIYRDSVGSVDVVYCDIAQPDETEIAVDNCRHMLRSGGVLFIAVKARSIDATRRPEEIFREEEEKLREEDFEVLDVKHLYPFDKDHAMIVARFRG